MSRFLSVAVSALILGSQGFTVSAQSTRADSIVRSLSEFAEETPGNEGYLTIAETEATAALEHVALALSEPGSLDAIRVHLGHVDFVYSPAEGEAGPGTGYGLRSALLNVRESIQALLKSRGTPGSVREHADHMQASFANVYEWWSMSYAPLREGLRSRDGRDAVRAHAGRLEELLERMVNGVDADGDGTVGWQEGEGGLAQMRQHLTLLSEATDEAPATGAPCEDAQADPRYPDAMNVMSPIMGPCGRLTGRALVDRTDVAVIFHRLTRRLDSTLGVTPATDPISDVPTTHPNYESIQFILGTGIHATFEDAYSPRHFINRYQIAVQLEKFVTLVFPDLSPVATTPTVSDMEETHWAYSSLVRLLSLGIIRLDQDGAFHGNRLVNRSGLAASIQRLVEVGR